MRPSFCTQLSFGHQISFQQSQQQCSQRADYGSPQNRSSHSQRLTQTFMTHAVTCTGVAFQLQMQSTPHRQPPCTDALMSNPHAALLVAQIHHLPSDCVFQFRSNVHSSSDSSTLATQRNVWHRDVLAPVTVPQSCALSWHTQRQLMPQGLESGEWRV